MQEPDIAEARERARAQLGVAKTKGADEKPQPSRAQRRAWERRMATRARKQARREREVAALTRNLSPEELEELDGFLAEQGVRRG